MCELLQYEYCIECDWTPPKQTFTQCVEWKELAAKAKKGDPTARQQLKSHMECKLFITLE